MGRKNKTLLCLVIAAMLTTLLVGCNSPQEEFVVPPSPGNPEMVYIEPELSGILGTDTLKNIENKVKTAEKELNGMQIALYLAETTKNTPISTASTEIFNEWGVGDRDRDNGVLITIAVDTKEYFISTGGGIEATLPDARVYKIVENTLTPHFKNEDYEKGILSLYDGLINEVSRVTNGEELIEVEDETTPLEVIVFCILLMLLVIVIAIVAGSDSSGGDYGSFGGSGVRSGFSSGGSRSSFGGGRSFGGGVGGGW